MYVQKEWAAIVLKMDIFIILIVTGWLLIIEYLKVAIYCENMHGSQLNYAKTKLRPDKIKELNIIVNLINFQINSWWIKKCVVLIHKSSNF